jgi:phosphatidylserine/phosphatidylglycerophosphate/cardiolipin synthase-like enzyme
VIAARIVSDRRARGAFSSLADLDERVVGVGPDAVRRMATAVSFDLPPLRARTIGARESAGDRFRRLMGLCPEVDPTRRLVAVLDMLATMGSTASRELRMAEHHTLAGEAVNAERVTVLAGGNYYETVQEALRNAQVSVTVCMFHIALPSPDHPTRSLLDELVEAKVRGVDVRVLVDRDRKKDPYRSEIINEAALQLLTNAGIACRWDASDRLMHSKVLAIDAICTIIGSHNWSAGSYFQYDDFSLLVASPAFATKIGARFDQLWAQAQPF